MSVIEVLFFFVQDWYSPDIEVTIRDTHDDTGLCGQVGIIRGVTPGMCSVFLPDEDRTVSIAAEHLQPVQPSRGDRVKVIMGKLHTLLQSLKKYFILCVLQVKIEIPPEVYCLSIAKKVWSNWTKMVT